MRIEQHLSYTCLFAVRLNIKNTLVVIYSHCDDCICSSSIFGYVTALAGKSEKEVAEVLGKPGTCSKIKNGPKCEHKDGQLEVVFIKGRADWITVNGLGKVPFSAMVGLVVEC